MKFNLNKKISRLGKYFFLFISLINIKSTILNAEESYFKEIEIDNSTKLDNDSTILPNNPFEMVEMIRKANSMNDATNPTDAIDNALKLFNEVDEKESL